MTDIVETMLTRLDAQPSLTNLDTLFMDIEQAVSTINDLRRQVSLAPAPAGSPPPANIDIAGALDAISKAMDRIDVNSLWAAKDHLADAAAKLGGTNAG
jgi:hypothetical protein